MIVAWDVGLVWIRAVGVWDLGFVDLNEFVRFGFRVKGLWV